MNFGLEGFAAQPVEASGHGNDGKQRSGPDRPPRGQMAILNKTCRETVKFGSFGKDAVHPVNQAAGKRRREKHVERILPIVEIRRDNPNDEGKNHAKRGYQLRNGGEHGDRDESGKADGLNQQRDDQRPGPYSRLHPQPERKRQGSHGERAEVNRDAAKIGAENDAPPRRSF